jgi:hypothetical protein
MKMLPKVSKGHLQQQNDSIKQNTSFESLQTRHSRDKKGNPHVITNGMNNVKYETYKAITWDNLIMDIVYGLLNLTLYNILKCIFRRAVRIEAYTTTKIGRAQLVYNETEIM